MPRRLKILVFSLLVALAAPQGTASAEPEPELVLDELGMTPRPSLECGGKESIQRWERERLLRRNERARKRTSAFAHGIGERLNRQYLRDIESVPVQRLESFQACLDQAPVQNRTCLAVLRHRAELCQRHGPPLVRRACKVFTGAFAAIVSGDRLRCAEVGRPEDRRLCERLAVGPQTRSIGCPPDDWDCRELTLLSEDICRSWWFILSVAPPEHMVCTWSLLLGAFRDAGEGGCDAVPLALRGLCDALVKKDLAECSDELAPPKHGVLLARPCRNAQVQVPEVPIEQVPYGNGLIISVPMINPFSTPAACRITVRRSLDGRIREEAVSEPFTLQAWVDTLQPPELKRFRMAPAAEGLELSVEFDCAWAPGRDEWSQRSSVQVLD